ncbi:hypothetical protein NDU88_005211 [Pleurodeles waltl]|uniref:Uncharacterized protein n=1 Tax=Pleurodeles waltl TaxID=8319 RepID=A0AAV7WWY6_PLEWA|nr:hypothetical protein NDU88_005211 [Pleurodeles waltl]
MPPGGRRTQEARLGRRTRWRRSSEARERGPGAGLEDPGASLLRPWLRRSGSDRSCGPCGGFRTVDPRGARCAWIGGREKELRPHLGPGKGGPREATGGAGEAAGVPGAQDTAVPP